MPDLDKGASNKRIPKRFHNREGYFEDGPNYWEYSANADFPYDQQNSRGRVDGYDVGYQRAITDQHRNLQGLVYHPYYSTTEHVRAGEQYDYEGLWNFLGRGLPLGQYDWALALSGSGANPLLSIMGLNYRYY
jgi:hypothetical protein